MSDTPLFTVIIDTFNRPDYLNEAVNAVLGQTYKNIELILINNGATLETIDYLVSVEKQYKNISLIHFKENQFSFNDPQMMLDTCLNAALKLSRGEYIFYQSDDDLIAKDYVDKMVGLFKNNGECITAAGRVLSVDENMNETIPVHHNIRPRYMPGHLLSLQHLFVSGQIMLSVPGVYFTVKRDALINAGGFHRALDALYLYGILPFGVTGFDETTEFYWRRHSGQLNKMLTKKAIFIGPNTTLDGIEEWELEKKWTKHTDKRLAKKVINKIKELSSRHAASIFILNVFRFNINTCFQIIKRVGGLKYFWLFLPKSFFEYINEIIFKYIRKIIINRIKIMIKKIFDNYPNLEKVSMITKKYYIKSRKW